MPPVGFEPTISAGERPAAAHLLRWIFVYCECRVLSGRGLCDELITRPEESYRLCRVVACDLETSRIGAPYIYDISSLRVKEKRSNNLQWHDVDITYHVNLSVHSNTISEHYEYQNSYINSCRNDATVRLFFLTTEGNQVQEMISV